MNHKLTIAQERFCFLVVESGSATEAYLQAYPGAQRWKRKSVHEEASRLLAIPKVASRVEALRAERQAEFEAEIRRQGVEPEDVVREQAHVGFFDPSTLFDADGQPLPVDRLPESTRRGLKTYKTRYDEKGNLVYFEYQAADKLRALRDLGDHLGMYRTIHEHPRWADYLARMTDAELDAEEARVTAQLEQALRERDKAFGH